MRHRPSLSVREIFGLDGSLRRRAAEVRLTLVGDATTPRSRFGLSSLGLLRPRLALPLWLGRRPRGREIPIYNLFNHRQTAPEAGWSTERTQVEDFRGGRLTYNSHNATDFAVAPGTTVVAPAPGRVIRVASELNRGGLKVFLDHGAGIITTSNHLARALVAPGDIVERGQPIALSGYSGIDAVVTFPFGVPHVHFNVWLDGEYVDPFARPGETSLWRAGNWPTPFLGDAAEERPFEPTPFDEERLDEGLRACRHEGSRREIESFARPFERAAALLFHLNYYPSRFSHRPVLFATRSPRRPLLDLPFSADDFDGIWFPDGISAPQAGAGMRERVTTDGANR